MAASVLNMSTSRKRRNPYTQIACRECKRRKVKCSGGSPCAACKANQTSCFYERSTRFRTGPASSPALSRSRGDSAAANVSLPSPVLERASNTSQVTLPDATATGSLPDHHSGTLHARPGSSDYYFGLARRLLVNSASQCGGDAPVDGRKQPANTQDLRKLITERSSGNQLSLLSVIPVSRWMEILDQYDEEIGLLYPFLDITHLMHQLRDGQGLSPAHDRQGAKVNRELDEVLVLVLAVMAVLEDPAISDAADTLTEGVMAHTWRRAHTANVSSHDVNLHILMSIYYFMTDRESLSWRNIGNVIRILQELGYHRSANIQERFSSEREAVGVKKVLWSAYLLDRRWSFGTGLPFAIQDSDIDYDVDFTDDSLSSSYLKVMVSYCRIAAEVRDSLLGVPSFSHAKDASRDLFDFRIREWRRNLPQCLQFDADQDLIPPRGSRGQYRLRLLLYLRANQMRIVIHRKAALRPGSTTVDTSSANSLAGVAQDTIRILARLAESSDIYQSQQKTFNHFLESGLSALLLVACCAKTASEKNSIKEVQLALNLIQKLSNTSSITRKLGEKLMCFANVGGPVDKEESQPSQWPGGRPTRKRTRRAEQKCPVAPTAYTYEIQPVGLVSQVVTPPEIIQDSNVDQGPVLPMDEAGRYVGASDMISQSVQPGATQHLLSVAHETDYTGHSTEQSDPSLLSSLQSGVSTSSPADASTASQFQPDDLPDLTGTDRLDEFFADLGGVWMDYDRLFTF